MKRKPGETGWVKSIDGSIVSEIFNPGNSEASEFSVALAKVRKGEETLKHTHENFEVYFVHKGIGKMLLGEEEFEIAEGDFILIPPGKEHKVKATEDLEIVCFSHPEYREERTRLSQ